ncbi:MAG: hypothetical protein ACI837_003584 [Crocinitomicaceae bacterium]|jgi:hypothetical protein
MKEAIFKDIELQNQFEEDGFVKLKVFSAQTIETLNSMLTGYFPDQVDAFFASSYLDDYDLKKEMSDKIIEVIQSEIADKFTNYRSIGAAFLIKGIGKSSEMPMHQDWTIVDEHQYFAINLWIPLMNTTTENGTIEVMKGSQKWNQALRAPSLPFPFEGHQERIKKSLTIVEAELGEVVVLNQAIIHYSKPNLTREIRPAITAGIISEKAPLIFHYRANKEDDKVELFEQEDDFLLRFENFHQTIFERPKNACSKGFKPYTIPEVTNETLDQFLGAEVVVEEKRGLFSRLFNR